MQVGASRGTIVSRSPSGLVDCFRSPEIDPELRDDLPAEAKVRTSAETIDSRHRESVEDVLLVHIDTVRPFARVEELQAAFERDGSLGERIADILSKRETIGDGIG